MPNLTLGVATLSFKVSYPTVDGTVSIQVPKDASGGGGQAFTLPAFSLSVLEPSVTIPITQPEFGGKIIVSLNCPTCEVNMTGMVSLDANGKSQVWRIGPGSAQYRTPIPKRTANAAPSTLQPITLAQLQPQVNNVSPSNIISQPTLLPRTSSWTKWELALAFAFAGVPELLAEIELDGLTINKALASALPPPATSADATDQPPDNIQVNAFGISGTASLVFGATGGFGVFWTSDNKTWGWYGSKGGGLALAAELSASFTFADFWPAAGQTAFQCFEGRNYYVSLDFGEFAGAGFTMCWAENDVTGALLSQKPCGVSVAVGVCIGLPANFYQGSSTTITSVDAPANLPPAIPIPTPPGSLMLEGDNVWASGLTFFLFASAGDATGTSGAGLNCLTGDSCVWTGQVNANGAAVTGVPGGWLTAYGDTANGPQLFGILYYNGVEELLFGADGWQASICVAGVTPPSYPSNPGTIVYQSDFLTGNTCVLYAVFSSVEAALANWGAASGPQPPTQGAIGSGQVPQYGGGMAPASIPAGWLTLYGYDQIRQPLLFLIVQFYGDMTAMLDLSSSQAKFYVR